MLHARLATKKNSCFTHWLTKIFIIIISYVCTFPCWFLQRKGLLFLVFCTLFLSLLSLMLINRHFGEEVRDKFFSTSKLTDKLVIAVTRFCCSRHLLKVLIAVQYDIPSCFIQLWGHSGQKKQSLLGSTQCICRWLKFTIICHNFLSLLFKMRFCHVSKQQQQLL